MKKIFFMFLFAIFLLFQDSLQYAEKIRGIRGLRKKNSKRLSKSRKLHEIGPYENPLIHGPSQDNYFEPDPRIKDFKHLTNQLESNNINIEDLYGYSSSVQPKIDAITEKIFDHINDIYTRINNEFISLLPI